jgi:DNA adenine methylase
MMQIAIDPIYNTFYPPKGQLLKWVGNKQKFAVEIARQFPSNYNKYFEPFLGSGAILATLAPANGQGSDTFKPLIEIWQQLIKDRKVLIEWYADRVNLLKNNDKVEVYKKVLNSYNISPNGADFLFLTRSCYGGIVRFRKSDGYMSTPCGAHTPIPIENFKKRVEEWFGRLKDVDFVHCDYSQAFDEARRGDLIYCDPPYSHSQSILYGAQSFKYEDLLKSIEKAKSRGVFVALSIDGHKKSGNVQLELPSIANLFQREEFIDCGKSMLRRFQIEGNSLESENVSDRLLLTY